VSKGKIGIFLPGLNGDIMQAMSVLKYKEVLWPDKDIVWFCSQPRFLDVLKYNDAIAEIRHWPEGWKLPERCELENLTVAAKGDPLWADFSILVDPNNRLDPKHKYLFESTKDLEQGYFPAPWMMSLEQRHGIDYPNISRKVFGANPSWEWHPYLGFSDEEREAAKLFCLTLPHSRTIMLETDFHSGVSPWDDNLTREVMTLCRAKLGSCNFIFACATDISKFVDDGGVVSASSFTVRQTALLNNYSDLFIGISSGISQAVNAWELKPTPKLQYCGSYIMSSASLANGPFQLIVTDPKGSNPAEHEIKYPPDRNHRQRFLSKLSDMLGAL